ncbi:hypothetical protein [Conexibacter sp. DBS9H8]|uniref:lipoate--protein ligase family protein n=1 Tax=Conexibacter sp. DBS9H8 TaxID=2937801 RepID=UPI00200CDAD1|nr:hypothetical protein [Conexibacter sp. DBS9H8]
MTPSGPDTGREDTGIGPRWRVLCDDGAGAVDGLALDEALLAPYGREANGVDGVDAAHPTDGSHQPVTATVRLYTYAPHCALVGHYQSLESELDLAACAAAGVGVGRRPTGGGAIIMGPDQLGVAIATRAPAGASPRTLLARYGGGLADGLAGLGIDARFAGKNDLVVGGRKIAGLGLYLDPHGALLFHASLLCDLDVALMLSVLSIPGAKLAGHGVSRVQERITTVSEQLGRHVSAADVRGRVADALLAAAGAEGLASVPTAAEQHRAATLTEQRYGAPAWLSGRPQPPGARASAMLATPGGLLRVYVGVQRDALSAVLFAGDLSVMAPALLGLETRLRWCRADPDRIAEIVNADGAAAELGVAPQALAETISAAAARALARAGGASPMRPAGSCYFPEPAATSGSPAERDRRVRAPLSERSAA